MDLELPTRTHTSLGHSHWQSYRRGKNFTLFINKEGAQKFKEAGMDDPAAHFKGKTIRVTGTVKLYREKPEIVVEDPKQVKVVEKPKQR